MAGLLSKDIKLSYNDGIELVALDDLQEIPELGGDVDKVEVTTLADGARRYINGLKDYGDLAFVFLYDNELSTSSYRVLRTLQEGFEADPTLAATSWEVELPDGTKFQFDGFPTVKLNGAGVNAPITFTLNIALNSDMTVVDPA